MLAIFVASLAVLFVCHLKMIEWTWLSVKKLGEGTFEFGYGVRQIMG